METNYELKHKCLLVPLKAALLVLVMVLIGFTTYAQQGKSVKVATDQQLIEAIGNPSVGTVELASGYYSYLNIGFTEGSKITKGVANNGNRAAGDCTYLIIDGKFCFDPDLDLPEYDTDPMDGLLPYDPPAGYNEGLASANTDEITCIPPFSGCCPLPDDGGAGFWSVSGAPNSTPPGATVVFDPTTPLSQNFNKRFFVDKPGRYLIGYTWPSTNSFAFTEYLFFGPGEMEVSAPDVCGLTTEVTFLLDPGFRLPTDPGVVTWTLTPYATGIPQAYAGPSTSDVFDLTVAECGLWEICVTYTVIKTLDDFGVPTEYCEKTICIDVEFACEPIADAGPDVNVCGDLCAFLNGSINGVFEVSPSFAYSWVNISGPQGYTLDFSPNGGFMTEDVTACRDEFPPTCSYGEYEVQFQVYNGYAECADDDNAIVRFYEQPEANAGADQHICNSFSFSLNAVPYDYCGDEGVNYWPHLNWNVISMANPHAHVVLDTDDPNTGVTITTDDPGECLYGAYVFTLTEVNSKGVNFGGCYDVDTVVVYIYEAPEPDAGEDLVLCDTWAFSLWGTGDTPCYTYTDVVYAWEKTAQPGECVVTITGGGTLNPQIEITSCADGTCPYGEYIFELTQSNGYYDGNNFVEVCSGTDEVSVWIFEPVDADAGVDQHICNSFAFTMAAVPTAFCGEEDTNYMAWGEWAFVSGPTSAVTIDDVNDPVSGVTIDGLSVPCPYGIYIFKWTEYNGMGTPFKGCSGEDYVYIYIDETPESINAGPDFALCNEFTFDLDGAVDMPCTDNTAYSISWMLMSQPDACDVSFSDMHAIDPVVTIDNCGGCAFGEYVFMVTQYNGYYDDAGAFQMVCFDTDEVSVWIFEQPREVDAGPEQLLCNDYTFDLTGSHAAFCGDAGVNYNVSYSWYLVSQPVDAGCTVTIMNGETLTPSVEVSDCTGDCPYGEFVFGFTVRNGNDLGYCWASDQVSIFILEAPDADAGEDIAGCFDIDMFPYCTDMTGTLEYCYSMVGVWTKTCGPGGVTFTDLNDAASEVCFEAPGLYKFTWTAWNAAEGCMDEEEVVFTLLEQPVATGLDAELEAPCDDLCIDLGLAGIDKYEYTGTAAGDCPNFGDEAYWSFISGPSTEVTFADDTDPETEFCVSVFGGYTVRWYEVNRIDDQVCTDWFDVYVEFNETPVPQAMGGEICGNCFTLDGTLDASLTGTFYWEVVSGPCPVTFDPFAIDPEVCIEDVAACYGTYTFVLHQWNGRCEGTATATITFKQLPPPIAICFENEPNFCGEIPEGGPRGFTYYGCLQPNEVLEVCAEGCTEFYLGPWCECLPGFDWSNPLTYHWTFEWSYTGPTGTIQSSSPGYYDWENGYWVYPYFNICWGECCDTARIYLTINTGECELDLEYKAYVHHKPCIDIVGPDVAEVGMVSTYCNDCEIPVGDEDCYLYTWTAEHCGEIIGGQGTPCIDVLWTDYNVNGGWGQITLTVFDICTGCCNYDEMPVKIWPAGTLGSATLSGYVYYHNNGETPLNGVEIQLWNAGIPVMSTTSFNDIEGGNGPGYYEFSGINGLTPFGVTASYDAPWYGANATDALAVELKTINNLPGGFVYDDVVGEAMDVNNLSGINGTDALWIKQRAINMVNFFPAGNWAFDPTMQTQAVAGFDIYALNMGDANRSNVPAAGKSAPAIDLLTVGTMNVVTNEVFELPIRIAKEEMFGAITLNLEYNPALVEVVEVAPVEGMLSNITSGNVSIAWSNVNPMVLAENDVVVTLKVKAISEISASESMFRIGLGSEFADQSASVIEPVTLKTFGITTGPAATDYFLSTNRPNPFNTSTFIEYTMPESGKVRLSVLDMLGQEIAVLVEATQTAGSYTVEFSAAGLATGVYVYKITVDGETRDFSSTQRMVISH